MYGQVEAFGEAQATAIEQLDRRAVSAQANVPQEPLDLLTRQDRRQELMLLGFYLREYRPLVVSELLNKEAFGGRQ